MWSLLHLSILARALVVSRVLGEHAAAQGTPRPYLPGARFDCTQFPSLISYCAMRCGVLYQAMPCYTCCALPCHAMLRQVIFCNAISAHVMSSFAMQCCIHNHGSTCTWFLPLPQGKHTSQSWISLGRTHGLPDSYSVHLVCWGTAKMNCNNTTK